MLRVLKTIGILSCLVLLPTLAFAQASITGVVKDSSGAVLPGVTVETSSPVLIEKTRSTVTDGSGLYRILDLRPGTYSVTFSLPGFTTVKREGIELTGSFIASINADMKVGGVAETITVSGETPIVDVQSVKRQTTLSNETLTTVPTARSWAATAVLIPGIVIQAGTSADIQVTPQMTVFGGAGGRANEGRMQVDGLNTGAALNGGGVSTYVADISNAAEVVTTTSGGLGEAEVGGPTLSIVPKSGGNQVKGAVYLSGVSSGMVGTNYNDTLKAAGLSTPGKLLQQWDYTGGVGGPILKDRLWYYGTLRDEGQHRSIPGIFPNLNAGDPTKFTYAPDTTKQAQGAESFQLASIRLTAQITPRNKFNYHQDLQWPCNGSSFTSSGDGCRSQDRLGRVRRLVGPRRSDGHDLARDGWLPPHAGEEFAVHVVVAGHEQTASRSRPRHVSRGVGAVRSAGEPDARPRAHHRARSTQRRQRRTAVPLGQLGARLGQPEHVAHGRVVCDGRSHVQGRVHRRLPGRGHPELRQRSEPGLYLPERPAQLVDADAAGLHPERPRPLRRALRAGSVDDGQDHAAGRTAV